MGEFYEDDCPSQTRRLADLKLSLANSEQTLKALKEGPNAGNKNWQFAVEIKINNTRSEMIAVQARVRELCDEHE